MGINVLDGSGGVDGKVSPRYLQRVVNRIVAYITDAISTGGFDPSTDIDFTGEITFSDEVDFTGATVTGIPDSRSYKVYSALLTQVDTAAPIAIVLENTFPDELVWAYDSPGIFVATLSGAFVENKTQCWIEQSSVEIAPGTTFKRIVRLGADTVGVICLNSSGDPLDGVIIDTPIEIRVYN